MIMVRQGVYYERDPRKTDQGLQARKSYEPPWNEIISFVVGIVIGWFVCMTN